MQVYNWFDDDLGPDQEKEPTLVLTPSHVTPRKALELLTFVRNPQ